MSTEPRPLAGGVAEQRTSNAQADPEAERIARHNFVSLVGDGLFFTFGTAFYDSTSVLPVFVSTLTSSSVLIGLSLTIRNLGWMLPQVFVARYVGPMERKKPITVAASSVQRLSLFLISIMTLIWAGRRPELALVGYFAGLAVFSLGDGVTSVPWTDIVGRSVPHQRRGRLFGMMQVAGGILAFGAGFVVRWIISHPALSYPRNFALLFLIGAILSTASLLMFCRVKEPPLKSTAPPRVPLATYFRQVPVLFRRNPAAARLVIVRVLATGINLAVPFFAVYGREVLGFPPEAAGLFVSAQMIGTVVGGWAWARIGDFLGNRLLVRSTVAAGAVATVVPLLMAPLAGSELARLLYPVAFAVLGATFAGTWMGFTNYLIETTPEDERPYYLGAVNTLVAPFTFFGVLGGLVVAAAGYVTCFAIAGALCTAALLISGGLPEPRRTMSAVR